MGGPATDLPDDALGQQAGQDAVDAGVRFAENERQLYWIVGWHSAECI